MKQKINDYCYLSREVLQEGSPVLQQHPNKPGEISNTNYNSYVEGNTEVFVYLLASKTIIYPALYRIPLMTNQNFTKYSNVKFIILHRHYEI